jgi:hypothetical protein
MWKTLYERMTGQPWTTERCASVEFGPSPAAQYREKLARYSDGELYRRGGEILADLMGQDSARWAAVAARVAEADRGSGRVAAGPTPGYRSSSHIGRSAIAGRNLAGVAPQGRGGPRKNSVRAAASGSAVLSG